MRAARLRGVSGFPGEGIGGSGAPDELNKGEGAGSYFGRGRENLTAFLPDSFYSTHLDTETTR